MDAYNTDVRPLLAELRESQGLDPDPIGGVRRVRVRGADRRRAGRRHPGRLGRLTAIEPLTTTRQRPSQNELRRTGRNRLGADPRNTNYAGGNTSAKGTATDPVTGQPTSSCCGSRAPAATWAR